MPTDPEGVFDGLHLRANLFRPDSPNGRLLVTFRHRIPDPGHFGDPMPSRRFVQAGWSHLHLQSRQNDWYVNAETEAFCAELAPLAARFSHCVGIGFSMGGYAALRYSGALAMAEVVAVSPQVSIHPGVVPFDPRFRDDAPGFDRGLGDLSLHARKALRGVVILDPFRPLDLRHAAMISDILPGLSLCRYGFGGHPATGTLRETVTFGAIQSLVLQGDLSRAAVLAAHRTNRSGSPSWWRAVAARADRTGHAALAAEAARRDGV